MQISALVIAHCVLTEGGIRAAARRLALPPQTVSATMSRLEQALAVRLTERGPVGSAIPLAAMGYLQPFEQGYQRMMALMALCKTPAPMQSDEQRAARLSLSIASLERLLAVAHYGSIHRVSQNIGAQQPQLSRQIGYIEKQLGRTLFRRLPHGVVLSEAGEQLLPLLDEIVTLWQSLCRVGDGRFAHLSRTVRVGSIIQTSPESWIARSLGLLVAEWAETSPIKPISVSSMPADALREGLKNKRLDVALIDTVEGLEGFDRVIAVASDLVAIAPPDSAGNTLDDIIASHPLCLTSGRTGLGQALFAMQRELGEDSSFMPMVEVESLPVLVGLVCRHGFMSLLARVSAQTLGQRVKIIEIGRPIPFTFYVVWRDTPDAKAVADRLLAVLRQIEPEA